MSYPVVVVWQYDCLLCVGICIVGYTLHHYNVIISHLYAGLLVDSIDVFDFAPGLHTATITVNNTLGDSDSESFFFFTPGQYISTKVPLA